MPTPRPGYLHKSNGGPPRQHIPVEPRWFHRSVYRKSTELIQAALYLYGFRQPSFYTEEYRQQFMRVTKQRGAIASGNVRPTSRRSDRGT